MMTDLSYVDSPAWESIQELLRVAPGARLAAGAPDTMPTPVPERVPVSRDRCLPPSIFDALTPGDYGPLIEALTAARVSGRGSARVSFGIPDSAGVTFDVFDTIEQFGVVLCVLTAPLGDEALLDRLSRPETAQRRSRLKQDALGTIVFLDESLGQELGYEPHELIGRRSNDLLHPEDLSIVAEAWRNLLGEPEQPRLERLRYRAAHGEYLWFDVTLVNRLSDDEVIVLTFTDVSGEVATAQKVAEREALLHQITESLPLGVVQVDSEGRARHSNSRLAAVLGFGVATHLDEVCERLSAADCASLKAALAAALRGENVDVRVTVNPPHGRVRVCEVNLRTLSGESAQGGALICFTEVTEAVRLQQQLEYAASHDALTGCLNRQAVLTISARNSNVATTHWLRSSSISICSSWPTTVTATPPEMRS